MVFFLSWLFKALLHYLFNRITLMDDSQFDFNIYQDLT